MKLYLSLIAIALMFFSCNNNSNKTKVEFAYIGGEIINPNSKFVILEKGTTALDTIKLDGRNRFIFKVDSLKKGLHTFRHGGEYQMVLIEPEDSILFRLNTLEFDESLVFTGKGSKKNNYFINEFLENEKEETYVLKLCQLKPEAYQKHIDSIKNRKTKSLEHFEDKYEVSELFKRIAKANIDYSYYSSKEVYPFAHYGKNKGAILKSLPVGFYDYRKDIDYNDNFLKDYPNYYNFLRRNFSNLSLETHYDHAKSKAFHRNMLCYNLDRLHLIDSLVTNSTIKDELLHHFTIKYISLSNNSESNTIILNSYLEKTSNEKDKALISGYVNSLKELGEGTKLPSLQVVDYNNEEYELNSIINSPTVISFWSSTLYDHFKDSHHKLKELKEKYPEIKFVTINIDDMGVEKTKLSLKSCRFNCNDEYLFKNPKESKRLLAIYPMTKTIIIDQNKKIVNANSNMFSVNFEEQLLGLINR
ncbi:TlpA family protein disulfide reductase [Seonamhaeicola maritimus]|uniref:Thioredoxin domain-containing protein n=1 Tax=Seonamhaeicola maritimus TaxID=2591822 RepID=A0A5C7GFL8_9FLAO|nr:hypothetical protein [Seonamhaeicola maritimus]TXG35416.1 hypothetical protein FUA22_16885 [Seonamhaeicola maritimus]